MVFEPDPSVNREQDYQTGRLSAAGIPRSHGISTRYATGWNLFKVYLCASSVWLRPSSWPNTHECHVIQTPVWKGGHSWLKAAWKPSQLQFGSCYLLVFPSRNISSMRCFCIYISFQYKHMAHLFLEVFCFYSSHFFVHFKLTLVCFPHVAQLSIKLWCRLNKLNGSTWKGSKLWSGAVHWWCESNTDGPQDYVRVAVGFQTEFKRPTASKRSARPGSVTRPSHDL